MKVNRSFGVAFAMAALMGIGLALMLGVNPDSVRADSPAPDVPTPTVEANEQTGSQEGICGRTQQVREKLVRMIPRVSDCAEVSASDLAGLDHVLVLTVMGIGDLKAGDFEGLTNLERLDLSGNELTDLPEGIFDGLTNLQALWLTGNSLAQLPDGVFSDLTNLRGLRLNENSLTELPDGIFDNNGKLRALHIRSNQLTELPDGIFDNNGKLRALHIWSNQLTELPDDVFINLTKLRELDLSVNDLEELPDGVFDNLAKLRVLSLGANPELAELADGVFDGLSKLEFLDLQSMSLRELPAGAFDDLSKLKNLDLSRNDLVALPDGIFDSLTSLQVLTLDQNSLTTLPEEPFDGLARLTLLTLENNSLNELPDGAFDDLSVLSWLYLFGNRLTELPDGALDNLSNLKYLDLQRNELTELPEGIRNLSELRELRLSDNEIGELPDGMFESMTNLVNLRMDQSGVTGLPTGINNLTKLEKLDLGGMEISELPEGFFDKLTKLRELNLGLNNLSELPEGFFDKLTELQRLDLGFNNFNDIPAETFDGASNLEEVDLWGNPGSPFTYFVLLEPLGEDSINVRMHKPAPFPVTAHLTAVGGHLSETSIDLPMGTSAARTVTVTRDSQSDTPVTISVRVYIETKWGWRIVSNGVEVSGVRVITDAPQRLGSSEQDDAFHSVCDRTEAVRTAILALLADIEDCADVIANHLSYLTTLELRDSGITSLKAGDFDDLLTLRYLTLEDNGLTSLPDRVFDDLSDLHYLYLDGNRLSSLPESVFDNLTQLNYLSLASNGIGELPDGVFDNLDKLTSLSLRHNEIEQLADDTFDGLTALESLDLAYNDIGELSDGVFDSLTALTSLYLHHNNLTTVPTPVRGLSQLEGLSLSENSIEQLPSGTFDSLTNLTSLGLSRNSIRELPEGIFDQLGQIETLGISTNRISELPEGVFDNLTNMKQLDISRNSLIELPDGAFEGLTNLQSVRAVHNLVSPLVLTARLERLGETEVAVRVAEATPFDIEVELTADHGSLSTSTVTVAAGSTRSDSITVTPGGTEPVTLSVSAAHFLTGQSDHISGIEIGLGRSLTPSEPTEANQGATGAPEVAGTAQVGEKLTASTSTIMDANGITEADFQFYWIRSDGETDSYINARRQEYRVGHNDVGMTVKARVKFTDDAGYEETLTSTSTATVPISVPGWPFPVEVQPLGAGELSVSWWEPRDGGAEITSYTVQWKEAAGSWDTAADVSSSTTTETAYTISGLSFSTRYAIRVIATNDVGNSEPSWEETAIAVARVSQEPNAPATGTPSISGTAQVGETLTAETSGIADSDGLDHAIFTYRWIRDYGLGGLFIRNATSRSYLVAADDVGKTLKVRVSFIDDAGNAERLTSTSTAVVSTTVPGAPVSGDVQPGGTGQLTVSWEAPASDGGSSITGYKVQWKEASDSWDTLADVSEATTTETSYTITGLSLGIEYSVRVIATNSVGDGPASAETRATADAQTAQQRTASENTPATGEPTMSGTLEVGQTLTADTSGIADEDGLANPAFGYQWIRSEGTTDTDISGATGASYTLVSADEGKAIKVRVSFTDDAGNDESLTSAPIAPDRPYGLTAAVLADAVGLTWKPPLGQSYMFDYQILRNRPELGEAEPLVHVEYTETEETAYTDTDVEPGVLYVYRVKAVVDVFGRLGEASEPVEIRTAEPTPGENTPATGAPTIGGTAQVGETLTADTPGIADGDGLDNVSFTYQWVADDTDIAGATGSSYTLVAADAGKAIKVRVSFTDDEGNAETLTSAATSAVAAEPTPLTAQFLDTPSSHDGQTAFTFELRFSEEFELSYVTLRDYAFTVTGGAVAGARRLDPPGNIRWEITVRPDGDGEVTGVLPATGDCEDQGAICTGDGRRLSNRTELTVTVTAPTNSAATGAPTISGTAQVGETLTADTSGIADGDGLDNVSFSYQWVADDTDIAGAAGSSYTLTNSDEGKAVKVRVSFTDDAGNEETLTSAATVAVEASTNHPAEGWLSLSGMAEVGQAMRVVGVGRGYRWGIYDEDGLTNATYNFQWIRSDGITDVDIHDATTDTSHTLNSSYTLADADEGKYIKARVSFTDDAGNKETLTSSSTTAVTARPSASDLGAASALTVGWSEGEEKGNELNWTAPEGTITGYQILRLETPTRSSWWEPYAYGCTPLMEVHVSDTGGDATTYTDTDVAEGASYTYSVRAISSDGIGRKSSSSRSLQYRPPHTPTGSYWPSGAPGTPYRVPTNLASSQIKNGIGLTWEAPEGEVTGYQILRRSPEQCDFGYRVYVENTNSTDTHWADRNVVAGTRYEYHVRAVNDAGAGRLDRSISTSLRPTTLVVGPEPNSPATGTPTISGTAQVGETLTADPSGIADADGQYWAAFEYQWLADDTEIEGATSSTYTLQASDANKVIKVRVDFMDDLGYEESLTSAATAAVSPNVSATGAPAITGTVEVGETLTADTSGISDTDGLENVSFSYQWLHSDGTDDLEIDGATSATYAITAADADKAIKLRVNFTDDEGSVESLISSATAVVPIEAVFTFSIDGTTVTCDSYNVHIVNVPIEECDDPTSTDQGASGEIGVEIEIARSVNSQLYKFDFHIYQVEDSLGNYGPREANDLCLGPGLADSVLMEVTPDDGTGNFTYTDEGTIFKLCPAGTYQLYVPWYRYNYVDQEYEYAGTFRRYFFINGNNDEGDTSIEKVKWITALYPDPPVSHGEVQIQGTKQSTVLNRELTTFSLTIDGLVPDTDTATTDYVVRVRIIGDGGPGKTVPWCHVGNVGYSYRLKTVPEDGRWEMDAHVLGGCISHWWPDTLQVELFDGSDLTDYSKPIVLDGSNIISRTGGLLYPENGTHEFIAGTDISLDALPNSPATGAPTISGTTEVGETLTADTSGIADTDGLDNVSFSYQWLSSRDTEISGATGSTYTLVSTDLGKIIKVKVSFTDDEGNEESLTSAATAAVADGSNTPATGAPTISDTMQVGQTLTASTSGIADDDGLANVSYTYQWIANDGTSDSDIQDATSSTYTLVDADEGKTIKVRVSFTDDAGNSEELTSAATDSVVAAPASNSPATGAPTSTGTAQVGETLTADTSSIADADGLTKVSYAYQWLTSMDAEIDGATSSTYTLVELDEGKTIKVRVSFTDDDGNEETLTSEATAEVEALLTAELLNVPASHNGQNTFTFRILFSEDVTVGLQALKEDSFEISNGTITRARRVNGRNDLRQFTVRPSSDAAVVLELEADRPCTDDGAICTSGDKRLANSLELTVPGPAPANTPATGAPTISGTAQVGQILTASTSGVTDNDGLTSPSYTYQWIANDGTADSDIQDATSSTYTLVSDDVGKTIKVKVSFTDDADNEETLTSAASDSVAAAPASNSPASGAPTIIGTAQVGETLTASTTGVADTDGLTNVSYAYQWLTSRDAEIEGATSSTYTLVDADEGKTIKVRVSFTDDAGNEETLTSEATGTVEARANSPATGVPTVSGEAQVGETLTADTSGISDADGLDNATFSYQWIAGDVDIDGATGSSYSLTANEQGQTIKVRVTFSDDAGNEETLTSAATSAVAAAPTPLTAQFLDTPSSHDGQAAFTLELRFSEEFELSYKTLRDHAFTVTGGEVTGARRLEKPSNIRWEISVSSDGDGNVTIVLPVTVDCNDQGAICTQDGRRLSAEVTLTVAGPGE